MTGSSKFPIRLVCVWRPGQAVALLVFTELQAQPVLGKMLWKMNPWTIQPQVTVSASGLVVAS